VSDNDPGHRSLAELVDDLQAAGRYTFDRTEALASLGTSAVMLTKAVMRLATKGRLVVPKRGFYVIVPVEYRSAGALPPSWFIDDLMRHLGKGYYVGVLSAAGLYGAAHQQPQEFQVVTELAARPVVAGRARIRFLGTKLRALHQRKKGRDLFDLWVSARALGVGVQNLVRCLQSYLDNDSLRVSRAEFEQNLNEKLADAVFQRHIEPLLATGTTWDQAAAAKYVLTKLVPLLPGEAWRGPGEGAQE
jgi:hypothetical protein